MGGFMVSCVGVRMDPLATTGEGQWRCVARMRAGTSQRRAEGLVIAVFQMMKINLFNIFTGIFVNKDGFIKLTFRLSHH